MSPQHTFISTIFTTKNKELAIFGNALSETRGKIIEVFEAFERGGIKGQDGIIDTFFSKDRKSPLTPELLAVFEKFKDEFNSTSLSAEALKEKFGDIDQQIIDYAKTCKNGEMTTEGFKKSLDSMSLSAKLGKAALQALASIGNMILFAVISKGIEFIVTGVDNWIHKVEKANETMQDAVSEYKSAKSSLESLTSELSEQDRKLDDLLAKEKLTYAEQGQLEELQAITQELLLQQDIEEKRANNASKEAADSAVDAFNKQYGKYDTSEEQLQEILTSYAFPLPEGKDDVLSMIAAHVRAQESLIQLQNEYDEALKKGEDTTWLADDIQYNIDTIDDCSQALDESILDLQEKRAALKDEYDKVIQKQQDGNLPLTSSDKEIIQTYETICNLMRMVYKYTDPNAWTSMQIENVFNTEGIEKTKDELVEMAREGTLDENMIQSYSKLSDALEKNGVSANELLNELEALAKDGSYTPKDPITFSSALSNESLSTFQSTLDSLKSSLTTLYNGDYSSTELISALASINSAMADIGKADSINWEEITDLDDLDDIIDQITNDYVDTMLDSLDMAGTEFGDRIKNVIQEELKASRQLETYKNNVSDLQSAYSSLTDVIETYNANGYITFDQLTALLEMEPQYLSCLIDANGQLQLNEQAMADLAQLRLDEAKAQVVQQAISELNRLSEERQTQAVKDNSAAYINNESTIRHWNNSLYTAMQNAGLAVPLFAELSSALGGAISEGVSEEDINQVLDNAYKQFKLIGDLESSIGSNLGNVLGKSSPSSDSSSTDDFKEQFDFFERRIKVLDNAVTQLKANLENLTGSFAKNQLLDQNSNILEERIRNYSDAAKMYQEKAQESLSRLDAETQKKIVNGSVSLNDYIGEDSKAVTHAMNDYKGWADKVAECTEELANLETQLRQLELDKFNHIVQDFTDQFDLRDSAKGLIDKQISLFEEAGQLVGKAFYEEQIGQTQKQLSLLETEKAQLVNQLNSALSSGRIQRGTEEWLEMVNVLSTVDGNILDCKKSIEEFDNAIQNLHWETFDRVQDTFGNLSDEISNLLDMMKNSEVATPDNQWTAEGLTQLGLYAQQYELATYQISQYADEIDRLNADYLTGKYSATEYADKLADLNSAQWKAVNAAESAKDSIIDLNESRINAVTDGIQKEIDAYKELINSQIEALDAEKDLHEYQNTIAEKSMSIAKLEKQLAAMQNDNTAATVAKRKQLEEQLTEARADLDETQYEHSVETQKEALNQQYEDYENARNQEIETLEETLKDRENIIAISMESVKQNTQIIASQITEIANQHGIKVSSALTNSWASGENAIASYGEVLSQGTSAFIGNIMAVESQIYQLQADADVTAISLANMFGTNADNLVNQLNASYFAEVNLLNMTNALQCSLINTLQGGYDVSNIVNSLASIENAALKARNALGGLNDTPGTGLINNTVSSQLANMGKNLNQSLSDLKASRTYRLIDTMTGRIWKDGLTYDEALQLQTDKNVARHTRIEKYASGTRNISNSQLAITNESGQELIYRAKDGSILTRLQPGDKVFNNVAAERLYQLGQGLMPTDIKSNFQKPALNNIRERDNAVTMNYDHLIEINGDVNDTDHFIKQISTVAEQAITNAVKTAEKTRKYGMF